MKKLLVMFLVLFTVVTFASDCCPAYNKGDTLPAYMERDGYMIPVCPANFARLGILPRVDAVPDAGKIITRSHGIIQNGQWVEVIDEQLSPEEIKAAAAVSHQISKTIALKNAENAYLAVAGQVPGYIAGDTASVISGKLQDAVTTGTITQAQALQIGLQLLGAIHDVEVNGGSWSDLPLTPHIQETVK